MGRNRNRNASTPTTDETPAVDTTPEATPEATETPEVTPEDTTEPEPTDETPAEDEDTTEGTGSADPKVFWVEGYGNVNAKSQAEAEKKARKILADQRK